MKSIASLYFTLCLSFPITPYMNETATFTTTRVRLRFADDSGMQGKRGKRRTAGEPVFGN
jgi:hypothetical protein